MAQENQRLLELCRQVSLEKHGDKMTELIRQLNAELDKLSPRRVPEMQTIKAKEARRA